MTFLDFNMWSFLLIIGIGQGLTLILILFSRKPSHPGLKILGFLVFILTIQLAEFLLLSSTYYEFWPHLIRVSQPFIFLIGPSFYFFIRSYQEPKFRFTASDLIHLIPFVLAFFWNLPWFLESADYKLKVFARLLEGVRSGVSLIGFVYASIHIMQSFTYSFLAFKKIQRTKKLNGTGRINGKGSFLKVFSQIFMSYWMLQLCGLIAMAIFQYYVFYIDYSLVLINSFLIQFLSFKILSGSKLLTEVGRSGRYAGSALSDEVRNSLVGKIENLMAEEVYLDPKLSLQVFSDHLSINKSYISQVINEEFGCGFSDYINALRVERAKMLMKNPENNWMKLLAIALESGFNNKTNFNRVFTKSVGSTPSNYRRSLKSA